jgi:hypothetical protein
LGVRQDFGGFDSSAIFVHGSFGGQHGKEQIFTGFPVKPVSFRVLKRWFQKTDAHPEQFTC